MQTLILLIWLFSLDWGRKYDICTTLLPLCKQSIDISVILYKGCAAEMCFVANMCHSAESTRKWSTIVQVTLIDK